MFAFTYTQVFATTDISAEVVFILPNFRRNQPLFGGAGEYRPPVQPIIHIKKYLHDSQFMTLTNQG